MRVVLRTAICGLVALGALLFTAGAAGAQSTTTVPPVRPIPVTGGQTATTTTAATSASTAAAAGDLPTTGVAADMLVPAGFVLIGAGAVLQAAARRRPRNAYGLL